MNLINTNYNVEDLIKYKEDDEGLFSILDLLHLECNKKEINLFGFYCERSNLVEDGFAKNENSHTGVMYSDGEIFRLDNLKKKQFNNRQFEQGSYGLNSVYFFGSSTVYQPFIDHGDSLHKHAVSLNDNILFSESVGFNHRFGERVAIIKMIEEVRSGKIKKGDYLFFVRDGGRCEHPKLVNRVKFETKEIKFYKQSCFFDDMGHLSEKGIYLLSLEVKFLIDNGIKISPANDALDTLFTNEYMCEISDLLYVNSKKFDDSFLDFQRYLLSKKDEKAVKCGSILVNCNPITLGHQFLIDEAVSYLDRLYLFVIESEKNDFSFYDRFNMIKLNYDSNDKVTVLRGGKFMCSEYIIPDYFDKDNKEVVGHVNGLEFESFCFGKKIAPILNIREVWLGEEPNCEITNYYNQFMKATMPSYGVNVRVIDRIKNRGSVISASRVRKYIKEGQADKIKHMVSEITWSYLKDKGFLLKNHLVYEK